VLHMENMKTDFYVCMCHIKKIALSLQFMRFTHNVKQICLKVVFLFSMLKWGIKRRVHCINWSCGCARKGNYKLEAVLIPRRVQVENVIGLCVP